MNKPDNPYLIIPLGEDSARILEQAADRFYSYTVSLQDNNPEWDSINSQIEISNTNVMDLLFARTPDIDAIFREKEISKTINDVYLVASGELIDITDEEARYIAERYFDVEDIKKAKWDTIKEELEKYITNERSSTKFFEIEENDYE